MHSFVYYYSESTDCSSGVTAILNSFQNGDCGYNEQDGYAMLMVEIIFFHFCLIFLFDLCFFFFCVCFLDILWYLCAVFFFWWKEWKNLINSKQKNKTIHTYLYKGGSLPRRGHDTYSITIDNVNHDIVNKQQQFTNNNFC